MHSSPQLVPSARTGCPPSVHVMVKPRGAVCNLACAYCFYLDRQDLYPGASFRMSDAVLESFTRQHIEAQSVPEVTFGWQGGEPTLMGVDFFRRALEAQQRFRKPGMRIINTLQTNGILLDDDWCRFLKENGFLVGLSLDGPADLHDACRRDRGGHATYDRVHRALRFLQRHGVEHNILCVVSRANADHPLEVYRHLRAEGVRFIQFIPAVGRKGTGVTEWTVRPEQWGRFLTSVYDEWVARDVGFVFVQAFDAALQAWCGLEPALCVHARECGSCLALEHNGDLYSCDHFVRPDHRLGNVMETSLAVLAGSAFQRRFGRSKSSGLPRCCRLCPVRHACNGGCPKDRFTKSAEGEPGLNWLCGGYRAFFQHVEADMRLMADLLARGRPASDIMALRRRSPRK